MFCTGCTWRDDGRIAMARLPHHPGSRASNRDHRGHVAGVGTPLRNSTSIPHGVGAPPVRAADDRANQPAETLLLHRYSSAAGGGARCAGGETGRSIIEAIPRDRLAATFETRLHPV